jgi:hypothetical protein
VDAQAEMLGGRFGGPIAMKQPLSSMLITFCLVAFAES